MSEKQKCISKRQLDVIEELFAGDMDEAEVLKKHGVSNRLYSKWLRDEVFSGELRFRIESGQRQGELIIARYVPVAAAKLVALTESGKEETARKACLDIISLPVSFGQPEREDVPDKNELNPEAGLSPALAGKLLAALAKEEQL
jgi:hypothetical protein